MGDVELAADDELLPAFPEVMLFRSCGLTPLDPAVAALAVGEEGRLARASFFWLAAVTRSGINELATGLPIPVTRS